jgi:hypothetical protein
MVSSVYFDGTGDYLSVADNAAIQLTGDFTIECNVFFSASTGANQVFISKWNNSSQGYIIYRNALTSKLEFAGTATTLTSSSLLNLSSWYHIAITRNGNNYAMYINGVSEATSTSSSAATDSATVLEVGRNNQNASNTLNGYISNLRITKGTALYTATFVPPPLPFLSNFNYIAYPSLLLRGAGTNGSTTFTDSSPNAFTVTAFGNAQISTAQAPAGMSSSMYFDGSGDYLSISSFTPVLATTTTPFTIEGWVFYNSFPNAAGGCIFTSNYSSGNVPFALSVSNGNVSYPGTASGTGYAWFGVFTGSAWQGIASSSAVINLSTWFHIAVSYDGTTTRLFVNGSLVNSATSGITYQTSATTSGSKIGADWAAGNSLNGYLSNVRFTNGAAIYRSNFTPPVLPLSATPETNLTPSTTASTITNSVYGVYQLA